MRMNSSHSIFSTWIWEEFSRKRSTNEQCEFIYSVCPYVYSSPDIPACTWWRTECPKLEISRRYPRQRLPHASLAARNRYSRRETHTTDAGYCFYGYICNEFPRCYSVSFHGKKDSSRNFVDSLRATYQWDLLVWYRCKKCYNMRNPWAQRGKSAPAHAVRCHSSSLWSDCFRSGAGSHPGIDRGSSRNKKEPWEKIFRAFGNSSSHL